MRQITAALSPPKPDGDVCMPIESLFLFETARYIRMANISHCEPAGFGGGMVTDLGKDDGVG